MSRIGKKPIIIPAGVKVAISGRTVKVEGPKGRLERELHDQVEIRVEADQIQVHPPNQRTGGALQGLTRTLVANMVAGVTEGYTKKLEIVGTGYRVVAKGTDLEFALGFSHPVVIPAPEGISFAVETPTRFSVSGIDKQQVGEVAANLRKLRKPDPYKGKGVRYEGEVIRRKAGKAGR